MCESSILNVCFLIALVSTNPIPPEVDVQTYPGNYCDQSASRNSLIGLFNEEQTNKLFNSKASICSNHQKNYIFMKIIQDRIINNPILVDVINDIHRSNNADVLNGIQNSKRTPNIVNNYIILPDLYNEQTSNLKEDIYKECSLNNPSICTRVKKNADKNQDDLKESTNYKQKDIEVMKGEENQHINVNQNTSDNQTMNNQKRNTRKRVKRPPEAKSESTQKKVYNENIDSIDLLESENVYQRVNTTKKSEIKTTNGISSKDKPIKSEGTENSQKEEKAAENTIKNQQNKTLKTTSRKKINGIKLKHGNLTNGKTKTLKDGGQKKKSKEIRPNKNDSRNKQKVSDSNQSRNALNTVPVAQDYQFSNMPYDSNSMYKYINAIMSNYQSGNNDFKDFPFNFSNLYQFPQLSNTRSGKKHGRSKSYKRRKHPKFYRRRNNRKRVYSRRKPLDNMIMNEPVGDIISGSKNKDITSLKFLEINENPSITNVAVNQNDNKTEIIENISKQKENISSDENEKENFVTSLFNESLISNSLPEETLYNPYPSFIVGIDDKVPIIFENSLIDDYYPDFTADEALQLTTEETIPMKYHGDKYHYVSNKNFNFGDFIKKRKRIAMKNMSKNSNLFFSETDGIKNFTLMQEDKESKEKIGAQKSPHLLDNPDFRTRKIDSNEIYEPYHYHNIFQDPEEGYNKYDIEDMAVVYSTPMSDKNTVKTKSCNDIEDGLSKWRKNKDSNVETVHARSKLAKYGLAL